MNARDVLIKVASYLCDSGKVVTINKAASETGIGFEQASEALESLSAKGLASKRTIDDFDESCYQANENTRVFCEKVTTKQLQASEKVTSPEQEQSTEGKAAGEKVAQQATTETSGDPVEDFLRSNGAGKAVIDHYLKVASERKYFKNRSEVWEKHIGKMVDGVSKELSS